MCAFPTILCANALQEAYFQATAGTGAGGFFDGEILRFITDTSLRRLDAGIVGLRGLLTTQPGAFNFYTYDASPPSAPAALTAILYADTPGGKIRLMARFPSGAAQQIAIEP